MGRLPFPIRSAHSDTAWRAARTRSFSRATWGTDLECGGNEYAATIRPRPRAVGSRNGVLHRRLGPAFRRGSGDAASDPPATGCFLRSGFVTNTKCRDPDKIKEDVFIRNQQQGGGSAIT